MVEVVEVVEVVKVVFKEASWEVVLERPEVSLPRQGVSLRVTPGNAVIALGSFPFNF